MNNKELRKQVLSDGTYKNYALARRKRAQMGLLDEFLTSICIDNNTGEIAPNNVMVECENIRRCQKSQRQKVEEHIKFLFMKPNYDLYFATFTFNDNALMLSKDTRKQAIRRLLSTVCADYIMNIDYGSITEREHYHAVIRLNKDGYCRYETESHHIKIKELDSYSYGYYGLEEIHKDVLDAKKLSRYETKLTLHSLKVNQQYISVKKGSMYQQFKKLISYRNKVYSDYQYPNRWERIQTVNKIIENTVTEENSTIQKLYEVFGTQFKVIE